MEVRSPSNRELAHGGTLTGRPDNPHHAGFGMVQREGGHFEEVKPGDVVFFEP